MPCGDRPGTEETDVGDDVLRVARLQPGQQVLLSRRFELEQAQGLALLDELEREDVVERHLFRVVQVNTVAGRTFDLGNCMSHRGQHPDAQDVQFDIAQRLDLLLRRHRHWVVTLGGRLYRQPVQERRVADDHTTGVHGHAVDQGVEALGQLPQRPVPARLDRQLPQLGQFGERAGDVRGPQVREALGDPIDVRRCDPQREAGVPQARRAR